MEHSLDVQTRLENLIWTVSGNYDLEISPEELGERLFEKSPYIAFYHAIEKGCFEKYFDSKAFNRFFTKKVYQGLEPSVLQCLGKLCIDSAIWKKASKERKGILNIRKKAFLDTLEKDAFRLSHTDWEYIEGCASPDSGNSGKDCFSGKHFFHHGYLPVSGRNLSYGL